MIIFYILGFFAFIWLVLVFPYFRCVVFNFIKVIINGCKDIFFYFWHRQFNDAEPTCGKMICFTGLFGKGKTLSEVHYVTSLYKQYNDKLVWKDGRFVVQRIVILSNIKLLTVPYAEFVNLNQLVDLTKQISSYDELNGTYTVVYVIIDELQNLLYCRNFKNNLSSDVLMVLTQIRKLHCTIAYTSTRFMQTDATVRQDTSYVVDCNKIWRLAGNRWFDAWDYENAVDVNLLQSVKRACWFVRNRDYQAYDTHALTEVISKDVESGNVIPIEYRNLDSEKSDHIPAKLNRRGRKYYHPKNKKA